MNDKLHFLSAGLIGKKTKAGPDKKYATFNRRMMAATIDSIIAMVTIAPVLDYFFATFLPLPPVDWSAIRSHIPAQATEQQANLVIAHELIRSGYLTGWLNNLFWQSVALSAATGLCWHYWSATPGKILLHMRVVDAKTERRISDLQIVMRLMGYVVSTIPICLGFFWIGIDKRRQAWHDKLADTVVIIVPRGKKIISGSEAAAPSDSPAPSTAE